MRKNLAIFLITLFFFSFIDQMQTRAQTSLSYTSNKPVTEPSVFAPGVISTSDYEAAEEFTPDGRTLFYVKSTPDFNFWTIVFSSFETGKWTEPLVAPFSGQYSDADPFITADGKKFFFISNRPRVGETNGEKPRGLDIWIMDKTTNGWGEPKNLGSPVNSDESEYFPVAAKSGTLYFGSKRAGGRGGCDLYRARFADGKYQVPENLGDAINTATDEFEALIAPDESFLIFMAGGRTDGLGGYDLYVSYNRNGKWTKAENLGAPVNTAADELSPKITRDGKYFFWTSARSDFGVAPEKPLASAEFFQKIRSPRNGLGDIYQVEMQTLKLKIGK